MRGWQLLALGVVITDCGEPGAGGPAASHRDDASMLDGAVRSDDAARETDSERPASGTMVARVWLVPTTLLSPGAIAEVTASPGGARPASNASVAVDLPGGDRVEARADLEGRALFDGIDWARGAVNATAWHPGALTLASRVGVTRTDAEISLYLTEIPGASEGGGGSGVLLSGSVSGGADRSGELVFPGGELPASALHLIGPEGVDGHAYAASGQVIPSRYEVLVPRDISFTLLVVEAVLRGREHDALAWSTFSLGPFASVAETVDLDLAAHGVVPDIVQLELPHVPGSVFNGHPTGPGGPVNVRTEPLALGALPGQLSFVTRSESLPDPPALAVELELVRARPAAEVYTEVRDENDDGTFWVRREGYPASSAWAVDWPGPVGLVSPAATPVGADPPRQPLHAPVRWTSTGAPPTALVVASRQVGWIVTFPEGALEVTVPLPPTDADLEALFGGPFASPAMSPWAHLDHCTLGAGVLAHRCARLVRSRFFEVVR